MPCDVSPVAMFLNKHKMSEHIILSKHTLIVATYFIFTPPVTTPQAFPTNTPLCITEECSALFEEQQLQKIALHCNN